MKQAERKAAVLRQQSPEQLRTELQNLLREQFALRFQRANSAQTNTSRQRWVRRKIAVIKTVLREQRPV